MNSALRGGGDPLNVTQTVPERNSDRYSPLWDVHPVAWTPAAIASGERERLESGSDVAGAVSGWPCR